MKKAVVMGCVDFLLAAIFYAVGMYFHVPEDLRALILIFAIGAVAGLNMWQGLSAGKKEEPPEWNDRWHHLEYGTVYENIGSTSYNVNGIFLGYYSTVRALTGPNKDRLRTVKSSVELPKQFWCNEKAFVAAGA